MAGNFNIKNANGKTLTIQNPDTNNADIVIDGSKIASTVSPTFTGSPTAPTQTAGDNSTKLATTAYVDGSIGVNTASLLNDSIGSYAFLISTTINSTLIAGTTYAGSGLKYTGINGESMVTGFPYSGGSGITVTGTWRAMGTCSPRVDRYPSTLFLRIA